MPIRIPGTPVQPPGQGGVGMTVPLPPPCPPCPDCPDSPPAGGSDCHGGQMIRAARLYLSTCCIYHFHLSCAGVGDMGWWNIEYEVNEGDDPPDFDFYFADQQREALDQTGFIPFQIDGHPGYSDEDETLDGYAATAVDESPPGADPDLQGWAETAFLQINHVGDGFSTLRITCIPYDSSTATMGDSDNPLAIDLAELVGCPSAILGCTINISSGGNFFDPFGGTTTPNRVWLFFVPNDGPPGCFNTAATGDISRAIIDGSVTSVTITSGLTKRPDPGGACAEGQCFSDQIGCSPSISDSDTFDTVTITGPIDLTEDGGSPGWWYIDAETLGLWDAGEDAPIHGVCNLNITTNLGTATCIVAHSAAI